MQWEGSVCERMCVSMCTCMHTCMLLSCIVGLGVQALSVIVSRVSMSR